MTNFNKTDNMLTIKLDFFNNGTFKILVGGNAKKIRSSINSQCKINNTCAICNNMENKKRRFKEITYYLIQLFYRTNKKYSCTQSKVGKLLSILAFKYARRGCTLFEIPIYKYPPNCGTLIKELTFIPKDIYIREIDAPNPDGCFAILESFDDEIEIPDVYKLDEFEYLTPETMEEINGVFKMFGAYPASELARLLNPIVDMIVINGSEELNLDLLKEFNPERFGEIEWENKVVDFIFR